MGQAKRELERLESLDGVALGVAAKAGALEECPIHSGIFIDQYDDDAKSKAHAIGTNVVKRGEVDGTREEFMEAISRVISESGDECYVCAKHRDE